MTFSKIDRLIDSRIDKVIGYEDFGDIRTNNIST